MCTHTHANGTRLHGAGDARRGYFGMRTSHVLAAAARRDGGACNECAGYVPADARYLMSWYAPPRAGINIGPRAPTYAPQPPHTLCARNPHPRTAPFAYALRAFLRAAFLSIPYNAPRASIKQPPRAPARRGSAAAMQIPIQQCAVPANSASCHPAVHRAIQQCTMSCT